MRRTLIHHEANAGRLSECLYLAFSDHLRKHLHHGCCCATADVGPCVLQERLRKAEGLHGSEADWLLKPCPQSDQIGQLWHAAPKQLQVVHSSGNDFHHVGMRSMIRQHGHLVDVGPGMLPNVAGLHRTQRPHVAKSLKLATQFRMNVNISKRVKNYKTASNPNGPRGPDSGLLQLARAFTAKPHTVHTPHAPFSRPMWGTRRQEYHSVLRVRNNITPWPCRPGLVKVLETTLRAAVLRGFV